MDLNKIAKILEKERCEEHNEKPKAIVKGESIEISCCCEVFSSKLNEKTEEEIAKEVEREMNDLFKDFQ